MKNKFFAEPNNIKVPHIVTKHTVYLAFIGQIHKKMFLKNKPTQYISSKKIRLVNILAWQLANI